MLDYQNIAPKVRIQIASSDDTPADVLEKLSNDPASEVRQAVGSNPNTPVTILQKLGQEFPEAIIANPIFNLLLLENSENKFIKLSLARSSTTSEETLEKLAATEDEDIFCAIAKNINTPIIVLEKLTDWCPPSIREDGCEYQYLYEHGSNVHFAVATNPKTPPYLLQKLAIHKNHLVRKQVAKAFNILPQFLDKLATVLHGHFLPEINENLVEFIDKLAGEMYQKILIENDKIVENKLPGLEELELDIETYRGITSALLEYQNASEKIIEIARFIEQQAGTPVDFLELMATHNYLEVRQLVADHPLTPSHILEKLAKDTDPLIVQCIASHPNASSTVLEKLAYSLGLKWQKNNKFCQNHYNNYYHYDKNELKVILDLIKNPLISNKALLDLANIETFQTMRAIAALPNVSADVLNKLTNHVEKEKSEDERNFSLKINVKEILVTNLNTPANIIEDFFKLIQIDFKQPDYRKRSRLCAIAGHPNTPVELLKQLAENEVEWVRSSVASNPKTPIDILNQLANDRKIIVVKAVASNSNTSVNILERLAEHDDRDVVSSVASNNSTPIDILEMLAKNPSILVKVNVAKNSNTSLDILEKLAGDINVSVRDNIAMNINTPVDLLERLARDQDLSVRASVARNINTPVILIESLSKDRSECMSKAVIGNPKTSAKIINSLANSSNPRIRHKIAEHPLASLRTLLKLAKDREYNVREALAQRPDLNEHIIENLIETNLRQVYAQGEDHSEERILFAIARHPNTPSYILKKLAFNLYDETRNKLIDIGNVYWLQQEVAANINTSISVLEKLQNSPFSWTSAAAIKTLKAKPLVDKTK